ncbi:MAG: sugar ABC transporter permease [Roseiflexaceae bacterium]|nr:sugar ABC transporter permease [Roseiflexaceae bacterium]
MAQKVSTSVIVPAKPAQRHGIMRSVFGRDWAVALPFIAPLVIIMVGLLLWPFLNAIYISFTIRNIRREEIFVGFANYARLLSDTDYLSAVQNTIVFTVISIILKLIVGMTIALLLHSRIPFRNILTGLMLLPWIVPEVVTAMAWRSIYDPLLAV